MKTNTSSSNNQPSNQQNQNPNLSKGQLYRSLAVKRILGGNRLELASRWVEQNNSFDDLIFVIDRFKTSQKKNQLITKWLLRDNNQPNTITPKKLMEFLNKNDHIIKKSLEVRILESFLYTNINQSKLRDEITPKDLQVLLEYADTKKINLGSIHDRLKPQIKLRDELRNSEPKTESPLSSQSIKSSASSEINHTQNQPTKTLEQLAIYNRKNQKYSIKTGVNLESLTNFLLSIEDRDKTKKELIESWLSQEKRISKDVEQLLDFLNAKSKSEIAHYWLSSSEEKSLEDLLRLLPFVEKDDNKSEIIKTWLSQGKGSLEDVEQLLKFVEEDDNKSKIAQLWLSEKNSLEDLARLLPFVKRNNKRSPIIESWLSQKKRSSEDVKQLLNFAEKDDNKSKIAQLWLLSSEEKSLEDLIRLLPFVEEDDDKSKIIRTWLSQGKGSLADVEQLLTFVKKADNKSKIAEYWISEEPRSLEDIEKLLPFVEKYNHRSEIIKNFVGLSRDNFVACAQKGWIGRGKYDIKKIASEYSKSEFLASDFPGVVREIYPNSAYLQSRLLIEGALCFDESKLVEARDKIMEFIKGVSDDDNTLELIQTLKKKLKISSAEVLSLADGRLSQTFESLRKTLEDFSVEGGFNETGIDNFKKKFPEVKAEEASLISYFSYCTIPSNQINIFQQINDFKKYLKPEVLQKIRENFTPSINKVLIIEKDFDILNQLLKDPTSLQNSDTGILSVLIVCEAFDKIKVSNYPKEQIDQFSFGRNELFDSALDEAENQKEEENQKEAENQQSKNTLTNDFKALLKKQSATNDEVVSFFEKLLNLEGQISEAERTSLGDFFNRDKFLLANLLKEDGGIDKFSALIATAADGCFANIGTHARLAVIDSFISDPNLRPILSVFNQHINYPVLSGDEGVDHPKLGSSASTIFADLRVRRKYMSPIAFVKKLKEEFFKNERKVIDAWEIIRIHYGKNSAGEDNFDDSYIQALEIKGNGKNIESLAADLATFFILQKEISNLLENKHLQKFKEETENLIKEIEELAAKIKRDEESKTKDVQKTQNSAQIPALNLSPDKKQTRRLLVGVIERKGEI